MLWLRKFNWPRSGSFRCCRVSAREMLASEFYFFLACFRADFFLVAGFFLGAAFFLGGGGGGTGFFGFPAGFAAEAAAVCRSVAAFFARAFFRARAAASFFSSARA